MYDIKSFYEAKSVQDAIRALQADEDAEIISGGTDVLIRVREGKAAGKALVSVHELPELKGVSMAGDGSIFIGAASSFSHIHKDALVCAHLPVLAQAVDEVGGPQTRNAATIGGNVCNGATSADSAPALLCYNARVLLEGPGGRREVPIAEFYTGPGRTVRERCEVCLGFVFDREDYEGWHGIYYKFGKREAMEIATLGCTVLVKLSADLRSIEAARLAYGVAAPTPIRCRGAEAAAAGQTIRAPGLLERFSAAALQEVRPRTSWRASREFRLQLIEELARRGLREAIIRAGGELA